MAKDKYDFIKELLENKKINKDQIERLLKLTLEIIKSKNPFKNQKRENFNLDENQKTTRVISKNQPHKPRDTSNFLYEFKKDNSGLKELIHEPNIEIDLRKIIKDAKHSPYLRYDYYKMDSKISVNYGVKKAVKELIKNFEEIGIPFWNETKVWPFGDNGSEPYTNAGDLFKKNYRLGIQRNGYSNLQNIIEEDFKKYLDNDAILEFLPDTKTFGLRAHFMTWIPYLRKGIQQIFKDCNQERKNQKRDSQIIQFKLTKNNRERTRTLSIIDVNSISETSPSDFYKIKEESNMFKYLFRSLCDWSVEFYFEQEDKSYRVNLLTPIEYYSRNKMIIEIKNKPIGFTHFLTFYDDN